MTRPTIVDLAEAAEVSVSTVNRVLAGKEAVRSCTVERILVAAENIGFYGLGSIRGRLDAYRQNFTFGVLLQQPNRTFYQAIGAAFERAAAAPTDAHINLRLEYMNDLSPGFVAERMENLGKKVDALAVVAAEHPRITQAIQTLHDSGVATFALISQLAAPCGVGYIGLDNWKVGRISAWVFAKTCKAPGKIGILVGNHRYRCQEMNGVGFRSYFREHAPDFQLLEPQSTHETGAIARELTENLLAENPDLIGLYISGGGNSGAIEALRESGRSGQITAVTYDLTPTTRAGLLDGVLTTVVSHPLELLASQAIAAMRASKSGQPGHVPGIIQLPFDIYTSENL
jgi:LacI family transcriptional regulator